MIAWFCQNSLSFFIGRIPQSIIYNAESFIIRGGLIPRFVPRLTAGTFERGIGLIIYPFVQEKERGKGLGITNQAAISLAN